MILCALFLHKQVHQKFFCGKEEIQIALIVAPYVALVICVNQLEIALRLACRPMFLCCLVIFFFNCFVSVTSVPTVGEFSEVSVLCKGLDSNHTFFTSGGSWFDCAFVCYTCSLCESIGDRIPLGLSVLICGFSSTVLCE